MIENKIIFLMICFSPTVDMLVMDSYWVIQRPGKVDEQLSNMLQDAMSLGRTYYANPIIKPSLGVNRFEYKNSYYFVDYFSHFIKRAKLTSTSSSAVTTQMKFVFIRHVIPCCVASDNGLQFSADTYFFRC